MNVGKRRLLLSALRKGSLRPKEDEGEDKEGGKPSSASAEEFEQTERERRCREAFRVFDKKGKGFVRKADLTALFRSMGQNPTDSQVHDMINEIDFGSGVVEFEGFVRFVAKMMKNTDPENEVKECYRRFDPDTEGIRTEELRFVLSNLPVRLKSSEVQEMIEAADKDGDGWINYNEFRTIMGKQ